MVLFSWLFLLAVIKGVSPVSLHDARSFNISLEGQTSYFNSPLTELKTTRFHKKSDTLTTSYSDTKVAINSLRSKLHIDYRSKRITMDAVKIAFTDQLVNRLIPHWYGTEWSFNGHTSVPQQGKIACGYFVSTSLRDIGLNLNRYRLAQKSPIDEARMISCGAEIITVQASEHVSAIRQIDELTQEGLYFIGFDEGHVGFLLKRNGKLKLIHSNYLSPVAVCIEAIEESNTFKRFDTFHLVELTHNDLLLQNWLNNRQIQ